MPDAAQDALLWDKRRVLLAVSLAVDFAPSPGVAEVSVTVKGKATVVRAIRPFPAATLMLLLLAPGHLQMVPDTVHPHSVPVRMASRVLSLFHSWKGDVAVPVLGGATDVRAGR